MTTIKDKQSVLAAISPREVVERAQSEGWAVGAYNFHNPETAQALLLAAEKSGSPIFMQIGRAIIPHMGLRAAFHMVRQITDQSNAEFIIHLDHGTEEEVIEAIDLGIKSIMFDGAHLNFEDNIRATRDIVKRCHDYGIFVEAELGIIPDADLPVKWADLYTDIGEAERFAAETNIDSLAISCGIVHGIPTQLTQEPLAIDLVRELKRILPIPLVMHGASGVPDVEIEQVIAAGISKINADTDLRFAFRKGMEDTWAKGDAQLEIAMSIGREYMVEATIEKMVLYGTAGKARISESPVRSDRKW